MYLKSFHEDVKLKCGFIIAFVVYMIFSNQAISFLYRFCCVALLYKSPFIQQNETAYPYSGIGNVGL